MIGAVAGDIIGSVYERCPIKTKDFPLFHPDCHFTDDTVLTLAIADAILTGRSYLRSVLEIGRRYPGAGYIPRIPSPTAVGETAQRCALVPWASPSRQITRCCSKQPRPPGSHTATQKASKERRRRLLQCFSPEHPATSSRSDKRLRIGSDTT